MKVRSLTVLFCWFVFYTTNAQLFVDDFGTAFTSISTTKWPSACRGGTPSSFNTSGGSCSGAGDYSYAMGGSTQYITTQSITIPAATCYELTFDYSYNSSISVPDVEIRTGASCGTTVQQTVTLANTGLTCNTKTVDLSAYAGQTIYLRFNSNSSTNFYIDNVSVNVVACGGGGGGGCVFTDNFASSSLDGTKWGCTGSSFVSSTSACEGTYYAYIPSSYTSLITTDIVVPATSPQLSFSFKNSNSFCDVLIKTGGTCGSGSYTKIIDLPTSVTCTTYVYDLSAYAGQTVNISFASSSSALYLDEVSVCGGASGSSSDYKWADNFSDNDLILNYSGNDGDEACTGCGNWVLSAGANLVTASATVNQNKSEAFPNNDARTYAVQLPQGEYLESPNIDLSSMESFKVSFYANKQGGSANWHSWSKAYLQIWDGSVWTNAITIKNSATASDSLNDYFIESGFGYHCYTFYKSATSPGNYYTKGVYVNPAFFTSSFKFRIYFDDFLDNPIINVDNITFRADNDGLSVIPCGISYWNGTNATYYGKDVNATTTDHAYRGYHLETNDPFGAGIPPNWTTHFNDADTGINSGYYIGWAVVSEQKIGFGYGKVDFQRSNLTGVTNVSMSEDASYTGPGYLYYYKQYADCDGSDAGSYESGPGIQYNFRFEYGIDFRPVFYQLGSNGIEYGGGVISLDEQMDMPCATAPMQIKDVGLHATSEQESIRIGWNNLAIPKETEYCIERSTDGASFNPIAQFKNHSGKEDLSSFTDWSPVSGMNYYRLRIGSANALKSIYSNTVQANFDDGVGFDIYPNPIQDNATLVFNNPDQSLDLSIYNSLGQPVYQTNLSFRSEKHTWSFNMHSFPSGTYLVQVKGAHTITSRKIIVMH